MRDSIVHVIELLLGVLLIGLGLLYLNSQYKALTHLVDILALQTIEDSKVYQQYSFVTMDQVSDEEVLSTIMGYREYPIMVDSNVIPLNGHNYELYFTYLRDGYYKKEYQYEANRRIVMILYTYIGT